MKNADREDLLIGLQAFQPNWNMFDEAWTLTFELSGFVSCTTRLILIGAHICASQRISHFFRIFRQGNNGEMKQTSVPIPFLRSALE